MKHLLLGACAALAALPGLLSAQAGPTPADLPSTALAVSSLDKDPAVAAARSAVAAAEHAAVAIGASPQEWTARIAGQRRHYQDVGASSTEWTAQLERPIRIGGKAELDRQLGEVEVEIARSRLGETRHGAARTLADVWLDLVAAERARALNDELVVFAESSLSAVEMRRRAGDASMLEVNVATADLTEVRRQATTAAANFAKAQAGLRVRFPDLPIVRTPLAEPTAIVSKLDEWRARILEHADTVKFAEAQLKKAQLTASRFRADRIPDPTIGVYVASEALRNERVIGVSFSIPLGGKYRDARLLQALQEVEVARLTVDARRRDIEREVAEAHSDAIGGFDRWRLAQQGVAVAAETARLMQRAYALGEADLQALILARRQLLDASRAQLEARTEALRWSYRLLIDAHSIWDLDRD